MNVRAFDAQLERFIASSEKPTTAKIARAIVLLEMFGHNLTWPHRKKIDANLFELRVRGKQEIRIFYTFHQGEALLLHAFVKKSEQIPDREIRTAFQRLHRLT